MDRRDTICNDIPSFFMRIEQRNKACSAVKFDLILPGKDKTIQVMSSIFESRAKTGMLGDWMKNRVTIDCTDEEPGFSITL